MNVQPAVAFADQTQRDPAEPFGLDGGRKRLELDDVAERGAPNQGAVGLEPGERFGHPDEHLCRTRAADVQAAEDLQEPLPILIDLVGEGYELASSLRAELAA